MANLIKHDSNPQGRALGLTDPFRLMEEMMSVAPFERLGRRTTMTAYAPTFEVKERDDSFVLRGDMPGVKEADLDVNLIGTRLSISGRREQEEEHKEGERYYMYERHFGSFTRTFTLPEGIDADAIEADLSDGVLTVVVPKRPEAKPRKISIRDRIKNALKS